MKRVGSQKYSEFDKCLLDQLEKARFQNSIISDENLWKQALFFADKNSMEGFNNQQLDLRFEEEV